MHARAPRGSTCLVVQRPSAIPPPVAAGPVKRLRPRQECVTTWARLGGVPAAQPCILLNACKRCATVQQPTEVHYQSPTPRGHAQPTITSRTEPKFLQGLGEPTHRVPPRLAAQRDDGDTQMISLARAPRDRTTVATGVQPDRRGNENGYLCGRCRAWQRNST